MRHAKNLTAMMLLSVAALSCFGQATDVKPSSPNTASELIPHDVPPPIVELTEDVDFTSLRYTFGRRKDFNKRCELDRPLNKWADAEQAKNFLLAYDVILQFLMQCPVDGRAHLWAISSLNGLGDTQKAEQHKRWARGLFRSIINKGDGNTPQTAYETISIAEEYYALGLWRLKRVRQQTVQGPFGLLDLLVVEPITEPGPQSSIYFNPRLHFVRLAAEFANTNQSIPSGKP